MFNILCRHWRRNSLAYTMDHVYPKNCIVDCWILLWFHVVLFFVPLIFSLFSSSTFRLLCLASHKAVCCVVLFASLRCVLQTPGIETVYPLCVCVCVCRFRSHYSCCWSLLPISNSWFSARYRPRKSQWKSVHDIVHETEFFCSNVLLSSMLLYHRLSTMRIYGFACSAYDFADSQYGNDEKWIKGNNNV